MMIARRGLAVFVRRAARSPQNEMVSRSRMLGYSGVGFFGKRARQSVKWGRWGFLEFLIV